MDNYFLWFLNERVEIKTKIDECIVKISNIENHIYLLTANNKIYYGTPQVGEDGKYFLDLDVKNDLRLLDVASCKGSLFVVSTEGNVFKCDRDLSVINEIRLVDEYLCTRGHSSYSHQYKVTKLAVGEYGQLFITDAGHLWALGSMPQISVNTEVPKRVHFFSGRYVYNANVGCDFAVAIVSKQNKNDDTDSEDEDVFASSSCAQCLSASCLTSPASQISTSELCPMGIKIPGSYDIETTSTSSKNDSSVSSNEMKLNDIDDAENKDEKVGKNIIFRNTEAAKEFLTRQISRMSSAGEEYLVECTEKPTRIIKENMTNVASFVYEGVKTVGDKVVTLSRHVSGSSDYNSNIENLDKNVIRTSSKDEFLWSLSQPTTDKELSLHEKKDRIDLILKTGSNLLNCEVWTWGNILHGQLGVGDIIKRERPMIITKLSNIGVCKVSVQSYHAAVLTLDGRCFIWGKNDHNQVTLDNNVDQSSPKLFVPAKNERIRDIICGSFSTTVLTSKSNVTYFGKGYKNFSVVDNMSPRPVDHNQKVNLFQNLFSSAHYTLLNLNCFRDETFVAFIVDEQRTLEEMMLVHLNIIKPLQKKIGNAPNAILYENLCKYYLELLYFLSANVQSLLQYNNQLISICDIIIFRCIEEFILVYRNYIESIFNIISIDGFHYISKVIEISQSLYKLRPETFTKKDKANDEHVISTILAEPVNKLDCYRDIMQYFLKESNPECRLKDILILWSEFVDEQENRHKQAESTKEFWLNSGKNIDFLKSSSRRLLRESHRFPISLQNASRFSSHWFILFTDLFVHVNGSTPHVHNLTTIWLEPQQDESSSLHQISMKMPEETLILCSAEPEAKIEWFHALQNAIKCALNKPDALQPPAVRNGSYTFAKGGFFKDATYTGRWLNGKMHGAGKVEWPDGKNYTGQFSNNAINGYGNMEIPNIGLYEGQWKDNQQNGLGILTYSNTDFYKGYFRDGLAHGHGFLRKGKFNSNAASFYIGDWIGGMKCGYGVMDDIVTGEKYIGGWSDNKKHGKGIIVTAEGVYYEGVFNQDIFTGQGIMILEDGTRYEGEFRGTGILNGRGILTLQSGHVIEGHLTGSWNEGIKISNGIFSRCPEKKTIDSSELLNNTQVYQKWKSLFSYCYQILGIPENTVADKNGTKPLDTQKIWQNVAVYLSNTISARKKSEHKFHNYLHHLDIIPPFGREKFDLSTFLEVKRYLTKAFESSYHPLGSLLNDLSEAYTTTYGGRAHPLLVPHSIAELHYLIKRIFEIVRFLFPALPMYDKECIVEDEEGQEEIIGYQSLLYPIVLPKVHHTLFSLFTLKNEQQERQYKRTLMDWNKQSDYTLMSFLSVDQKFFRNEEQLFPPKSPSNQVLFVDAIENLQQIKSTFSPMEKLTVIRQTVEKMTPVAQEILGKDYIWNMDDLFPLFLYVVVRARIPDLGSELDFVDNFMDPSLESGELGIMFTTLKACYQQILQEKSSSF